MLLITVWVPSTCEIHSVFTHRMIPNGTTLRGDLFWVSLTAVLYLAGFAEVTQSLHSLNLPSAIHLCQWLSSSWTGSLFSLLEHTEQGGFLSALPVSNIELRVLFLLLVWHSMACFGKRGFLCGCQDRTPLLVPTSGSFPLCMQLEPAAARTLDLPTHFRSWTSDGAHSSTSVKPFSIFTNISLNPLNTVIYPSGI